MGQTCICPDYLLVHKDVEDQFVQVLKKVVIEFFGKEPQKSADYSRIINERHTNRLVNIIKATDSKKIVLGGNYDIKDKYIAPTIIRDVQSDDEVMKDEVGIIKKNTHLQQIFGPILPIIKVDSVKEAVHFIRSRPKPLALYIFSTDKEIQEYILNRTSAGGVCINDTILHNSVPTLPFGGGKKNILH